MEKRISLSIVLGVLVGVFFTNSVYLIPSIEGVFNLLFGVMSLIGIILVNR